MAATERQKVKDMLSLDLRKIETEIVARQEQMTNQAGDGQAARTETKPVRTHVPTKDIKQYGRIVSDL